MYPARPTPEAIEEIKKITERTHSLLSEYRSAPIRRQFEIEAEILDINERLIYGRLVKLRVNRARFDDFLQVGRGGMLLAIRRFDSSKKCAFSTFAVTYIDGVIYNNFRDTEWAVNVSREDKEKSVKIAKLSNDELAKMQLSEEELKKAEILISAQNPADLPQDYLNNVTDGHDGQLVDDMVTTLLEACNAQEADLLDLHYLQGYTVGEISVACILPPTEVSAKIESALKACRRVDLGHQLM